MKKKAIIISILTLVFIIFIIIVININNKQKQEKANDNIQPAIYYSLDDIAKIPLIENKEIANNARISWTKDCKGEIKKEGQKITQEMNTLLVEEGNYEITITSPSGKNKVTKNLTIDKTPPQVEIEENESGTYTIVFKDTTDVAMAELTRIDAKTKKIIKETNLMEEGLQQRIEVKEKGRYVLKVEDKLGNAAIQNTKFEIK